MLGCIDQAVKKEVLGKERPAKKFKRSRSKPVESDVIVLDDDPSPSIAADNVEPYNVTLNNPSSFVCLPCFWCEATFNDPQQLQTHLIGHSCCVICDAQFTDIKKLNAHSATHPSDKQMQCLLCGVTYFRIQKTEEHAAMHDGHDVFECTSCKLCISSSDCRNHMLTPCHSQELMCEPEIPIPGTVVITPITEYVPDTGCMEGSVVNDTAVTSTGESSIQNASHDDLGNQKNDYIDPVTYPYSVYDSGGNVLYSVDVNLVNGSNLQRPVSYDLEDRKGDIKLSLGDLLIYDGTNIQNSVDGHHGGRGSDKCGPVEHSKSNIHYSLLGQLDEQSCDAKRNADDAAPAGSSAAYWELQGSDTLVKVERQEDGEVIGGLNPPPENPLQCHWCELVLEDLVALQDHLVGHCRCVVCDQRFSSVGELGQHMLQHPGNKFMRCVVCKTVFCRSSDLMAHAARNSRHVFYECTSCGEFSYKNVGEHLATECQERISLSNKPALGESMAEITPDSKEPGPSEPWATPPEEQQDQTQNFVLPLPEVGDYNATGTSGDLPGLPDADRPLSCTTAATPKPALNTSIAGLGLPALSPPNPALDTAIAGLGLPALSPPNPALDTAIGGLGLPDEECSLSPPHIAEIDLLDADGSLSPPSEGSPNPCLDTAVGNLHTPVPANTSTIARCFTPVGVDETRLICNRCKAVFSATMFALSVHLKLCYNIDQVPQASACFECGSLFTTAHLLMRHRAFHHVVTPGSKKQRYRFRCLHCLTEFRHRRSLRLHVDTTHV